MKVQESKIAIKSLSELIETRKELKSSMDGTAAGLVTAQKLWREGNDSKLIRIGMAVFLFPEPTPISLIVGTGIMAAGAIQKGIKNRAIYMEDVPKTLANIFKELGDSTYNF